jgi:hypothetical protein
MDIIEDDELWDYYSGLPNPMWYQHTKEIEDEITHTVLNPIENELLDVKTINKD